MTPSLKHFALFLCLISTLMLTPSAVTAGPQPVQQYFVGLPEDELLTALQTINNGCAGSVPANPVSSYVSVVMAADGGVVYIDHWEDGFESDTANPIQASTRIYGDGDLTNGIAPGFPADLLARGDIVILNNDINTATIATLLDNGGAAEIIDGRDSISASVPITVSRTGWAAGSSTLFADAVELLSTLSWGTNFSVPVGQDTVSFDVFEYVGASIMASEDGTTVNIDLDADGIDDVTQLIDQGETVFQNGGIFEGATITATNPIQVVLVTGDICGSGLSNARFESRWYTLYDTADLSDSYYSPVASLNTNATLVYLHNPTGAGINVNVDFETTADTMVALPAGGTASVTLPQGEGTHFTSTAGFAAIGAVDAGNAGGGNTSYDWGFTLIPEGQLRQQSHVSLGFPQNPLLPYSENGSPVWVIAVHPTGSLTPADPIDVCIDHGFDRADAVAPLGDIDSNGIAYDEMVTLNPLEVAVVRDSTDNDQTGSFFYVCDGSDGLLALAWGQEPGGASVAAPAIDVGTAVPAFPSAVAVKDGFLANDVSGDGNFDVGDTITYQITVTQAGNLPVPAGAFTLIDTLPAELTYVPGTTVYTYNMVSTPIADNILPATVFPLDLAGVGSPVTLGIDEAIIFQFDVIINSVPALNQPIINQATIAGIADLQSRFKINIEASVGDRVWIDADGDGAFDVGEGVPGVAITLLDAGNNVFATTTTGADGFYIFNAVDPGTYTVVIDAANFGPGGALEDTVATVDPDGGFDNQATLSVDADEDDLAQDFGFVGVGEIGDTIFNDMDNDGSPGVGEGINGVLVNLLNSLNVIVASTNTNATGNYLFSNVPAGNYTVQVAASNFNVGQPLNGLANTLDPDGGLDNQAALTVTIGSSDLDQDFAYQGVAGLADIGDTIFDDLDGDGLFDAGEGIAGVIVNLRDGMNNVVVTTVTAAGGTYLFNNLPAGNYTVEVDPSNFNVGNTLAGYSNTVDPDGGNDNQSAVVLVAGVDNLTQDFGFETTILPGTIGDYLWFDGNLDGIQSATEPPLVGVTVSLYDGMVLVSTTTTDSNGAWSFSTAGLIPGGTYTIQLDNPNDYISGGPLFGLQPTLTGQGTSLTDSDLADLGTYLGFTIVAPTAGSSDTSVDGGLIPLAPVVDLTQVQFNVDGRGNRLLIASRTAIRARRAGANGDLCPAISSAKADSKAATLEQIYNDGVWVITWTQLRSITFDFDGQPVPQLCQVEDVSQQLSDLRKNIRRMARIGQNMIKGCDSSFTRARIVSQRIDREERAAIKAIDDYPSEIGSCEGSP